MVSEVLRDPVLSHKDVRVGEDENAVIAYVGTAPEDVPSGGNSEGGVVLATDVFDIPAILVTEPVYSILHVITCRVIHNYDLKVFLRLLRLETF
jgi:hypothetical protein